MSQKETETEPKPIRELTFDELLERFVDPSAPPDHSFREAIAEHGREGLLGEMRALVRPGERLPGDIKTRIEDVVSQIMQTPPAPLAQEQE